MKKWLIFLFLIIIGFVVWGFLFKKDTELKAIPKNADAFIILDTKNIIKSYIYEFIVHPEKWADSSNNGIRIPLKKSGLELPDFIQIFHLKGTPFGQWHCLLSIKDDQKFKLFLKSKNFQKTEENLYISDEFFVKIFANQCIISTGKPVKFNYNNEIILKLPKNLIEKSWNSNLISSNFTQGQHGSFSILKENKIITLPIKILKDKVVFNPNLEEKHKEKIQKLSTDKNDFLVSMDKASILEMNHLFFGKQDNALNLYNLSGVAKIITAKDSIVTYEYDDNFNEIAKTSFQEIAKPIYFFQAQSANPKVFLQYAKNNNWINEKNEFVKIPFTPNKFLEIGENIQLTSIPIFPEDYKIMKGNYVFLHHIKESASKITELSVENKKYISKIKYIFVDISASQKYLEIGFECTKLPIILEL